MISYIVVLQQTKFDKLRFEHEFLTQGDAEIKALHLYNNGHLKTAIVAEFNSHAILKVDRLRTVWKVQRYRCGGMNFQWEWREWRDGERVKVCEDCGVVVRERVEERVEEKEENEVMV